MKCGVYTRVSTELQKDNFSVTIQKEKGVKWCTSNGYDPVVYEDVISGSNIQRPNFSKLVKDIQDGEIRAVWVIEFSRLSRNDEEDSLFIRHLFVENNIKLFENGIPILFDTPEDKLFYNIRSSVAAYERRKIRERMNNGLIKKYSLGERVFPKVYGYDYIDGVVRVNEEEKNVIELVFDLVLKGDSYGDICKNLMTTGKKRKNGKINWTTATISKMLRQVVYTGYIKNPEGKIIKSTHYERIISEDVWERTRQKLKLKKNYTETLKVRKGTFELSGLLRCEDCESKYFRKSNKKKGIERGFYIHIANTPERLVCKNKLVQTTIDEKKLNYLVRAMYLKNFEDYDSIKGFYQSELEKIDSDNDLITTKIKEMKQTSDKLKSDKKKLVDAVLNGVFSLEDVKEKRVEIDEQLSVISSEIDNLQKVYDSKKDYLTQLDDFSEDEIMRFWDLSGKERKDLYIRRIKHIKLSGLKLTVEFINNVTYTVEDCYNLDEFWSNRVELISTYYE